MFGSGLLATASLLASHPAFPVSAPVLATPATPAITPADGATAAIAASFLPDPAGWSIDAASRPADRPSAIAGLQDAATASGDRLSGDGLSGDGLSGDGAYVPRTGYDFGRDVHAARWEMAAIAGVVLVPRIYRAADAGRPFHFKSEGWFGRDTYVLGMDKPLHAWKAYVITDVVQSVIARRTGDPRSAAITAGLFGMAVMTLAEVGDGFSRTTGFAYEDEVAHVAGVGVSMVRNMVPGLREKLDFRLQIAPKFNGELSDTRGRAANSKYLLALQLAGFEKLENTPLRFAELHLGYFARGFTDRERERGVPLRRHVFMGLGFNVQQLFARRPRSTPERLGKGVFDYIQVPYTAIHS